jgi:hypothetical protein
MQLWPRHLCRPGLHRSSGLQRAQAIRMTRISEPKGLADETIAAAVRKDANSRFLAFGVGMTMFYG